VPRLQERVWGWGMMEMMVV